MSEATSVEEQSNKTEDDINITISDTNSKEGSPILTRPRPNKRSIDTSRNCLDESPEKIDNDITDLDNTFESIKSDVIEEVLPFWNAKEKIILVIDRAQDDHFTPFKQLNGNVRPFAMVKRSVELFLHLKQVIDKRHEFAVVFLTESSAFWALNFTKNIKTVINLLNQTSECKAEDIFYLNTLFNVILENVQLPKIPVIEDELQLPPPFVVRLVLFYGRSYTLPTVDVTSDIEKLLSCPNFTMDVLMTHEPVDTNNNCNKIFEVLQNLDRKGLAYFFPVARDSKSLHNSVAKLLSHPAQRPPQQRANYEITN